jgi:hypothetical protein
MAREGSVERVKGRARLPCLTSLNTDSLISHGAYLPISVNHLRLLPREDTILEVDRLEALGPCTELRLNLSLCSMTVCPHRAVI